MPMDDLLTNVLQQYDTPVTPPKENTPTETALPEMPEQSMETLQMPQAEIQQSTAFEPPQIDEQQAASFEPPQLESQQVRPLQVPEASQAAMPAPEFPQVENEDKLQGTVELNPPAFPEQTQSSPTWTPPKTVPFGIDPIPRHKLNVPEEHYKPQITTDDAYTDYNPIVWT